MLEAKTADRSKSRYIFSGYGYNFQRAGPQCLEVFKIMPRVIETLVEAQVAVCTKFPQVEPYFKILVPTSFIFVCVIGIGEMKIRENPSGTPTLAYLLVSSEPRPRHATDLLSIMTYAELQ